MTCFIGCFLLLALCGFSGVAPNPPPKAVFVEYDVDIQGILYDTLLFFSPSYRSYRKLGLRMQPADPNNDISFFDIKGRQFGFLSADAARPSFLISPDAENGVAFSPNALAKIHSLFAFAAHTGNTAGAEHFVAYAVVDGKSKKTMHHAMLLLFKCAAVSPIPGVAANLLPNGTKAWHVALWALKSEHTAMTRQNFYEQGKPNIYAEGYVAGEGALCGAILGLEVHLYRSKEYFVRLVMTGISVR